MPCARLEEILTLPNRNRLLMATTSTVVVPEKEHLCAREFESHAPSPPSQTVDPQRAGTWISTYAAIPLFNRVQFLRDVPLLFRTVWPIYFPFRQQSLRPYMRMCVTRRNWLVTIIGGGGEPTQSKRYTREPRKANYKLIIISYKRRASCKRVLNKYVTF